MKVAFEPCHHEFELDVQPTADGNVDLTICAVTFSMTRTEFAELTDKLVQVAWSPNDQIEVPR